MRPDTRLLRDALVAVLRADGPAPTSALVEQVRRPHHQVYAALVALERQGVVLGHRDFCGHAIYWSAVATAAVIEQLAELEAMWTA